MKVDKTQEHTNKKYVDLPIYLAFKPLLYRVFKKSWTGWITWNVGVAQKNKNWLDLEMTWKVKVKVTNEDAVRYPGKFPATFVSTIFLSDAYVSSYSAGPRLSEHPVYHLCTKKPSCFYVQMPLDTHCSVQLFWIIE